MYPTLLKIGTIVFPSYATMLFISFIVGALLWYKLAADEGIPEKHIFILMLVINISAIIGARILFIMNNLERFHLDPKFIFSLNPGGFAFYGGFIFALIASVLYVSINHLPIWKTCDTIAPSISLGLSITRIGCYLSGCCFGKETTLPWSVQFPPGSPAALKFGLIHQIHPSQLYELLYCLIVFLILLRILKNKYFDGQVFLSFLIFYSIMRTLNEITRGDVNHDYLFNLTQVQIINLILLCFALILYKYLKNRKPISTKINYKA